MTKEENKINFDLSTLKLKELIELYTDINAFLQFLNEKRIIKEEKGENQDE